MILVGRDPATPREGEWSAHRLKQMLQDHRGRLLEEAEEDSSPFSDGGDG